MGFCGTCLSRSAASSSAQYQEAVDGARDPAGYRRLRQLLHAWRLTVIAASRAGYEELQAVLNGTARTAPSEEVVGLVTYSWRPSARPIVR
jgi:hypothetical protein